MIIFLFLYFLIVSMNCICSQYELTICDQYQKALHAEAQFIVDDTCMYLTFEKRQKKNASHDGDATCCISIGSKGVQQLYERMLTNKENVFVQLQQKVQQYSKVNIQPCLHK